MKFGRVGRMVREVFAGILRHHVASLAAAIAFYTLFSLAPMGIVILLALGPILGEAAAKGQISDALTGMVGAEPAHQVEALISQAKSSGKSVTASILGLLSLVVGATGMFTQVTRSLNTVWEVRPHSVGHGVWHFFRHRLVAMAMALCVAALLLASALASATVSATRAWVSGALPEWAQNLQLVNIVFSVGFMTMVFALMLKALPARKVPWESVWVGAFVTALLFWLGKFLVGLYLGVSGLKSVYGAAGSLVVLLLWVYYCSYALLLGTEIARAWAVTAPNVELGALEHRGED